MTAPHVTAPDSSARGRVVLAVDTATDTVVTGVARISSSGMLEVAAQRAVSDGRRHAEILTTLIGECLAQAEVAREHIDAVVVGTGPGPFTGLRVGMATGAGFADALGVPVFGVCSLDAIAWETAQVNPGAHTILVATDARRREVYWALYAEAGRVRTIGPQVTAPAAVGGRCAIAEVDAVGGSVAHLGQIGWAGTDPSVTVPTVAGLVCSAYDHLFGTAAPAPLVPLYLRRPDAVERKDQRAKPVGTP